MARGYDLTAQMRMPFYQHLNTSVSVEQYFGDQLFPEPGTTILWR
jgi:hypothetical protein